MLCYIYWMVVINIKFQKIACKIILKYNEKYMNTKNTCTYKYFCHANIFLRMAISNWNKSIIYMVKNITFVHYNWFFSCIFFFWTLFGVVMLVVRINYPKHASMPITCYVVLLKFLFVYKHFNPSCQLVVLCVHHQDISNISMCYQVNDTNDDAPNPYTSSNMVKNALWSISTDSAQLISI